MPGCREQHMSIAARAPWAAGGAAACQLACLPACLPHHLQECGFTEAAAFKARQPYPPTQTVHGTVLAKVQQDAGAGASIAAGAAEQQGAAAAEVQQQGAPLAVLGDAAQQQREVLLRVVQLGVAAAAGAALTLLWSRRAKGSQAPRQILSVHASPRW